MPNEKFVISYECGISHEGTETWPRFVCNTEAQANRLRERLESEAVAFEARRCAFEAEWEASRPRTREQALELPSWADRRQLALQKLVTDLKMLDPTYGLQEGRGIADSSEYTITKVRAIPRRYKQES